MSDPKPPKFQRGHPTGHKDMLLTGTLGLLGLKRGNRKQRNETNKHASHKNKCKNQHIDLYSFQIQIPKCQCKNKINNRNMISPEPTDEENKIFPDKIKFKPYLSTFQPYRWY